MTTNVNRLNCPVRTSSSLRSDYMLSIGNTTATTIGSERLKFERAGEKDRHKQKSRTARGVNSTRCTIFNYLLKWKMQGNTY